MADKEFEWDDIKDPSMRVKFRDMGDGTFALIGSLPVDNPSEVMNFVLINDTTLRVPQADASSHAMEAITFAHHKIHEGDHFFIKDVEDLGNTATYYILFAVPNTPRWIHLFFDFWHEKEMSFSITEGVTTGGDGTAVSAYNNNRNSTTVPTIVVTHTPTTPVGGTVIYNYQRGDGNKGGGEKREEDEIELKANMKYLITATNISANDNLFDYHFKWYEHESLD